MREDFLHYVWQQQYFDKQALRTHTGEEVTVLHPGFHNTDAGPDFLNARLQLGEVEWNGAVEIHLRASDWRRHQHQTDARYDQVILHVVLTDDQPVLRTDGTPIPTVALAGRIPLDMLHTYQQLQAAPPATLPCAPFLPRIPDITRISMVDRALLERMERKAATVQLLHQQLDNDWEATAWHVLAAGFGFRKNTEPLARLAKALPLRVLRRHRHNLLQTEALLFGQAGFLSATENNTDDLADEYVQKLVTEYEFLRHKYALENTGLQEHEWNFLRMRPANFPTVRLAQLAALLHARPLLFDALLSAQNVAALEQFFSAKSSAYWHTHYRPGRAGNVPALGRSSMHLLIINVVVPLRVAYARTVDQAEQVEAALHLLTQLPAEKNHILALYEGLPFTQRTAADSQGLLMLATAYCQPLRCVECAIGSRILRHNSVLK
ncbi:hypothetical protein PK28_09125 [Hymenobacter sp. DG25B]|uniref:DUF2851 family protein n=1 Tax=Hymenobacter sp. DG25B TaxID=1385664 RepID=UPI00054110A0|nr:DUF2851 family protein [Hymenobacter sp. DG25B]AIZ63811.1 hypothetical protein PK28_09125 [Hymenobacter sp. DG25B]